MLPLYWIPILTVVLFIAFLSTRKPSQKHKPITFRPNKQVDFQAVNVSEKKKKAPNSWLWLRRRTAIMRLSSDDGGAHREYVGKMPRDLDPAVARVGARVDAAVARADVHAGRIRGVGGHRVPQYRHIRDVGQPG